MLTKRIIPCLDIQNGRTVKGVNFENIRDAGDPVELAIRYCEEGADELVFLDITATSEKRKTLSELVTRIASAINIPFTVGGGISTIEDVSILLNSGADKISINTSAFKDPNLIKELAKRFGSQCIVLAIDAKFVQTDSLGENGDWFVYLNGGKIKTEKKAFNWAKEAVELGAGEILLTSMNNDGTKNGFANNITKLISENVNVPVIASGGAGSIQHFYDAFTIGKADAALAASVFHFNEINVQTLKKELRNNKIEIRL
ncbi:MAG TPA: imidazole glycerol phosphate synthase subunit HisF [Bacteroidia bacterium]|jgi:cyclase|nr:imidazole glycerol phosphate synthase subunit HisF [Bacteroidia bacterium]